MNVHELAPGLSFWMAAHPAWEATENWPEEVLCVYFEASDGIVLVDPLLPRGHESELWRMVDEAVDRTGQSVRVLLTSPWHARDTSAVVDRYGASVWAPPRALWKSPMLTTTQDLPAGVEALLAAGERENQALLFIREHGTLVTGDVFSGTGGKFHVLVDDPVEPAFLDWLPSLYELPVERVLIAHGEPVLVDGSRRIREAVAEARALHSLYP
jgi:hypothetical protein